MTQKMKSPQKFYDAISGRYLLYNSLSKKSVSIKVWLISLLVFAPVSHKFVL